MTTVVIQAGNSDNKLTQGTWANFVAAMQHEIRSSVHFVHFEGGSDWDAPWQNACWVCEIADDQVDTLRSRLTSCRKSYDQDSVAFMAGSTEFI